MVNAHDCGGVYELYICVPCALCVLCVAYACSKLVQWFQRRFDNIFQLVACACVYALGCWFNGFNEGFQLIMCMRVRSRVCMRMHVR